MEIETDDLKYKSLNESVYCPPFKEDNAIDTIELDEFDVEAAKKLIKESIALLSYNNNFKPLIVEILDVLDQNKHEFLLDQQKYLSFYWSGILILRITIKKEVNHNRQLHVSLQKYKSEKENKIAEKRTNRVIMAGLGGSLLIGGFIAGLAFFKSKN